MRWLHCYHRCHSAVDKQWLLMLSKILLTLTVLVTAFFFVRQRKLADGKDGHGQAATKISEQERKERSEFKSDLRFAAYMTLVLMAGLGGMLYYFRWQEDHEVLTVTLHRDNQTEPISYQVYRYQLQDRSFVTVDGVTVTVAGSERMEVLGVNQ